MSRSITDLRNDELVQLYIALRDQVAKEKAEFEASVADKKAKMDKIEGILLHRFNETGDESVRTKFGTAYRTTKKFASVADWDALLGFIREKEAWELLTRAVNKAVVEQYIAANDELPPGVSWREEVALGFRRS
jgi:hypothetical protein